VRLELHPEARAGLRSAALWYDERRQGLGDEFIAEVSATLNRTGDAPESYPPWPRTRAADTVIRKAIIQRFPLRDRVRRVRTTFARVGRRPLQTPANVLAGEAANTGLIAMVLKKGLELLSEQDGGGTRVRRHSFYRIKLRMWLRRGEPVRGRDGNPGAGL
jgi:hypothetical protein